MYYYLRSLRMQLHTSWYRANQERKRKKQLMEWANRNQLSFRTGIGGLTKTYFKILMKYSKSVEYNRFKLFAIYVDHTNEKKKRDTFIFFLFANQFKMRLLIQYIENQHQKCFKRVFTKCIENRKMKTQNKNSKNKKWLIRMNWNCLTYQIQFNHIFFVICIVFISEILEEKKRKVHFESRSRFKMNIIRCV